MLTFNAFAQVDRSQQPLPGPAPVIQLGEPERFSLKNGLTVLIVENNKLPRAAVSLSLDNAPIAEGELAGVSAMTAALLGKGSITCLLYTSPSPRHRQKSRMPSSA